MDLPKRIVGNWKMYKTPEETKKFFEVFIPLNLKKTSEVWFAVPYVDIAFAKEAVAGSDIEIGAQNVHEAKEGAYTGEISVEMLRGVGASFTLVGHSERRRYFQEDEAKISQKIQRALEGGLSVILCVGESQKEREEGQMKEVLTRQLIGGLKGISSMEKITIAYEPIWAIGTGKAAIPEEAQEAHAFCRKCLSMLYGEVVSQTIRILYGGSVSSENGSSFLKQNDIDGVLVGGASLKPEEFARLANI